MAIHNIDESGEAVRWDVKRFGGIDWVEASDVGEILRRVEGQREQVRTDADKAVDEAWERFVP